MRRSLVGLFIALFLSGCGGGALTGAQAPRSTPPSVAVSDDAFPNAVRDLLLSEAGSKEERARLKGVEERQMLRAEAQFKIHSPERGVLAVQGGLYLVRTGEIDSAVNANAAGALSGAVHELAGRGDEGGSQALYDLLFRVTTDSAARKDIQQHLDAIHAWKVSVGANLSPMQRAGAAENTAVQRSMLEPSEESRADAEKRIGEWVEAAIKWEKAARAHQIERSMQSEEDQLEAIRALNTGGSVLAVLHLRTGDVSGALSAIDDLRERGKTQGVEDQNGFTQPELLQALLDVDKSADAGHWLELLHALRPHPVHNDDGRGGARDEEMQADVDQPELLRAAAFGVAREAFRADPSMPESAGAVAIALQEYGMADASPAVLIDAVRAHADPRVIGESLTLSMQAIAHEVDAGNTDGARRAYKAAAPLIALAEQKEIQGKATPSAARIRAMMGEVELHDGNVADAKKLFEAAVAEEPSGGIFAALARIDRAAGNIPAANDHLKQALAASDSAKDSALRGEILLMQSDIAREGGDMNAAKSFLTDALKGLAKARTGQEGEGLARIERMLARVLDRFGAAKQARSALDRALAAAPRDKDEMSATLGIAVAAALVHNDVESARAGLHRGASSDLTDEDLVYLALWARATEKQMKVTTDGDADKVFASIADDGRWIGRLCAFASGKIKADDLVKSAKTPAQKTEAAFYVGLDRRAAGDVAGAQTLFKQALSSGGVDLMEVGLARDILEGPNAFVTGPVPDVGLP